MLDIKGEEYQLSMYRMYKNENSHTNYKHIV